MKKSLFLPVFGAVFFIAYILTANFSGLDFFGVLKTVNPLFYGLTILVSVGEIVFFALTWKKLVNFLHVKLGIVKSFLYVMYGSYLDILIPAESISGEISRAYLVSRDDRELEGKSIASVVFHRFINTVITTVLLVVCLVYTIESDAITLLTVALLGVQGLTLVMILLFCFYKTLAIRLSWKVAKVVTWFTKRFGTYDVLEAKIEKVGLMFHDSINQYIHSKEAVMIAILYASLSLGCAFGVSYLVFMSIDYRVLPLTVILSTMLINAIKAIPVGIPFEVGLPEITMTTLYAWFGLPLAIVAVSTILTRIVTLWFRFVIGFISYQIVEIKHAVTMRAIARHLPE